METNQTVVSEGTDITPPLPADVMEAVLRIPETLAGMLASHCRGAERRTWFPDLARNAQMAVLGESSDLATPQGVYDALLAYLVALAGVVEVGRAAVPFARDKWRGQKWTVEGVYEHSVLGPREVHCGGLLLRALSGESRYRLINEFRAHQDASRLSRAVVFYGVRDPLEPRNPYWTRAAIEGLPGLMVSDLARAVLWLSNLDGGAPETERGLTDGNQETDFLLRTIRQSPTAECETDEKRSVAREWLYTERNRWQGFTPDESKGNSLFGLIGRAIRNAFLRNTQQKEHPVSNAALEALQIDTSARVRGELVEIDTSLLASDTDAEVSEDGRAVVGWLDAPEGRNNFAERTQVKCDVEAAFRAVYRVFSGRLDGVARRDFWVFMARFIMDYPWSEIPDLLKISPQSVDAAKQNLERKRTNGVSRTDEIKMWLRENGYQDNRRRTPLGILYGRLEQWQRDTAHQHDAISLDGGSVTGAVLLGRVIRRLSHIEQLPPVSVVGRFRPEWLQGRRVPSVEISRDWERGTNNCYDFGRFGGTRVAL